VLDKHALDVRVHDVAAVQSCDGDADVHDVLSVDCHVSTTWTVP